MSDQLKEKTSSALFWNFIDKGGQQIIQLVFMIVLARLLEPEEFGLITILAIFTAIANILQESGFSSALIRKKDASEEDYSSVFYFNIGISIVSYLILFVVAPFIADFYKAPILTSLSRFIFLAFVFNAFGIIQNVHLTRRMDFRSNAKITFIAGLLSGIVAVWMAYSGYGVWSLAVQLVLQAFMRSLFLWLFVKWHPRTRFVSVRLKSMLPYSFNLLITAVFNQIVGNLYPIIIGKHFSISQAGCYGQAYKLTFIPQSIITNSLQGVAYPLFTKIDENERIKKVFRKIVRVSTFVSFPVVALMIITAKPLITMVLPEKWLGAIPIFQILAIGGTVYPLYCILGSLIQAFGKSGLLLRLEVFRNILSIGFILITVNFGILEMAFGLSLSSIVAFIVSFYAVRKNISYRFVEAVKDILPYFIISVFSFLPSYFLEEYISNNYLLVVSQTALGLGLYIFIVKILGSKVFEECMEFVKNKKFK